MDLSATNEADLRHLIPAGPSADDRMRRLLEQGTARNPKGIELTADQFGLVRDQRHWMPVMGEMQYARVARSCWRDALLKMKAGGIDIVATYVFWIHHEEEEGVFDFSGRRSLRDFTLLCAELGLEIQLRIGPWDHGEARNGGFPDWLLKQGHFAHSPAESRGHNSTTPLPGMVLRTDDPKYLSLVRRFFHQLSLQASGLLWKDGGPVTGIQVENEYSGPAEHLLTLKQMAFDLGMDVPLFYYTGWPKPQTPVPFGKLLPLFGGYAEGMWDRNVEEMPGSYWEGFTFRPQRLNATIATDHFGVRAEKDDKQVARYPYLTCEMGGGMVTSYHRRVRIFPHDVASVSMIKIGCGNSLPGYYVYHGGTNPGGKLSTLNESQATGYPNDICVKSYDFQAPIGEFGQLREHYHRLRRLHLMIHECGERLIGMRSVFPTSTPHGKHDLETLRWCVRGDATSAFIFVNNYQRLQPMPQKRGVQFTLKFAGGDVAVPRKPLTVPADCYFIWPVNLQLGDVRLIYATAELLCTIQAPDARYIFFSQIGDMPVHFAIGEDAGQITSAGEVSRDLGTVYVENLRPSLDVAIRLVSAKGEHTCIVVLDELTSLQAWQVSLNGRSHLALSSAAPLSDGNGLRCRSTQDGTGTIALLPAPAQPLRVNGATTPGRADGAFIRYDLPASTTKAPTAIAQQIRRASAAQPVLIGPFGVAEAPGDSQFAAAAVWMIVLPDELKASNDWFLRFHYVGDVARVYLNGRLITDNFYNGVPFDCGFNPEENDLRGAELLLKIMPLRKDAPIYLLQNDWPQDASNQGTARLERVEIIREIEHLLT